ncbi:uncharacterized protein LOC114945028 [Nylanderia fulva]|uniref:uncharacterized protein LOC114945028 n=1 Tax=Nylanderia fulva TaxID=613905 RepID=UPI0010FAFAE2|nr:uncharacterized protein LOC114945028 [Nylanderia fulva]
MDENNILIRRGCYKRYLQDDDVPVPESTIRSRRRREQMPLQQEQEINVDDSMISRQPFVSSNDNTHTIAAEDISEDSDSNINGPISGNPENKNDTVSVIIESNFNLSDEISACSSESDVVIANDDASDLEEDIVQDYDEFLDESAENVAFVPPENNDQERVPLYEQSNISKIESELLILNFAIRHNLTDVALEDLITLINCHLPYSVYHTKYIFMKKYDIPASIRKCYYCPECYVRLKTSADDRAKENLVCQECQCRYDKHTLRKSGNYFLYLPLKQQLRDFVNSDKYALLQKGNDNYSDITSGQVYTSLKDSGIIQLHDITLQISSDGVQVFHSSSVSMWPIQVMINELPYRERRKNMMLCGLWYGKEKPDMNLFLSLLVEELISLHEVGITRNVPGEEEIHIRVHTIASPVDSVARPLLQNIKQYNGSFGCSFCLHEGIHIEVGKGMTRVYPGYVKEPRTLHQHEVDCEIAVQTGTTPHGVKGPTVLMLLPVFDITSSFTPDYMHSVLLEVTKTFTDAWFNSSNHEKNWYIGNKVDLIDEKLLQIKPPCEITRTPRSINERNLWKASEWKNFLLYYSLICLQNVMPLQYVRHWFLFICSMHIFLQEKINGVDFSTAKNALKIVPESQPTALAQFNVTNSTKQIHIESPPKDLDTRRVPYTDRKASSQFGRHKAKRSPIEFCTTTRQQECTVSGPSNTRSYLRSEGKPLAESTWRLGP